MMRPHAKRMTALAIAAITCAIVSTDARRTQAADHGDAPGVAHEQSMDIGDAYFFLDPNDNAQVVMAMTTHGFIVPFENANLGFFDSSVRYRFQIENTGDAIGDLFIDVTFSKQTSRTAPQTATIVFSGNCGPPLTCPATFTAPSTVSSGQAATPPPATVTTVGPGITFFAGLTDDPFFFDGPAELLYRASLNANAKNGAVYGRGRDAFAGYNILTIALSVPKTILQGPTPTTNLTCFPFVGTPQPCIGLAVFTQRRQRLVRDVPVESQVNDPRLPGAFVTVDRMGVPAVNTVFIPFSRKDEYNAASTLDDATGRFAADVVKSLVNLQTNPANIGILANLVVFNGDMLRLNLNVANSGPGGGNNGGVRFAAPGVPSSNGFPNGRRPQDDVIDTIVFIVSNQVDVCQGSVVPCALQGTKVDNVDANDVPFRDTFPFFAPPQQPFNQAPSPSGFPPMAPGLPLDDRTRN